MDDYSREMNSGFEENNSVEIVRETVTDVTPAEAPAETVQPVVPVQQPIQQPQPVQQPVQQPSQSYSVYYGSDGYYSSAPAAGSEPSAPVPPYEDPYIRRIDEMARERNQEERRSEKKSFLKRAVAFVMLAVLLGVIAGGTYFAIDRYVFPEKTKTSETPAKNDPEIKQGSEIDPIPEVELREASQLEESQSAVVTAVDVSSVVESVMPAVVGINNYAKRTTYDFWGSSSTDEVLSGSGSGIIIGQNSDEVLIVTNNHVVAGASKLEIEFCDKTRAEAVVRGAAASSDLAVVSVPFTSLSNATTEAIRVARIGDSNKVKVGQMAIAIGNALGYGQSVTVGYISALNREVTIDGVKYNLIQTDAAINPGNSGGALVNQKGEVIAINSAKATSYGVEGMGYAIPISNVREIITELSNRVHLEDSEKGFLGIGKTQDISSSYSSVLGMPQGVYVQEVIKDSPADQAGMISGDIVTRIGNDIVSSITDIQYVMSYTKAGTRLDVVVQRRNSTGEFEEIVLDVTLGSYEEAKQRLSR